MEVHRQRCQACRSIDLRNILVREVGRPQVVFVRCAQCGELVARYELSAYYHHGKDLESYLRSQGAASAESGRRMLDEFKRAQTEATEGYETVLTKLTELEKPV